MRAGILFCLISFLPFMAYADLVTGAVGPISGQINIPTADAVAANSSFLTAIDPGGAVRLSVAGATGTLTHPACVAETKRRAALTPPQSPPSGDFPCVVPASNGAGTVSGVCFVNVCKGVSATGLGGVMSLLGSLAPLSGIVAAILGRLLQAGQSAPSVATDLGTIPTPAITPTSSSQFIKVGGSSQTIDMSLLFTQSAVIVRDLLSALKDPTATTTR